MKLLGKISLLILALALIASFAACTPEEHKHSAKEGWLSDAENHWHACSDESCQEKIDVGAHTAGTELKTDGITEWNECTVCGARMNEVAAETHIHNYSAGWINADGKHYKECECGAKRDEAACTAGEEIKYNEDFTKQWNECTVCGGKMNEIDHTHTDGDWLTDVDNHWKECTACGQKYDEANHHSVNMEKNETQHWGICDVCDATVDPKNHTAGTDYITDDNTPGKHWNICTGCDLVMNVEDHSYSSEWTTIQDNNHYKHYHACACGAKTDEADCVAGSNIKYNADYTKQWNECVGCGAKMNEQDHTHSGTAWTSENSRHWKVCACGEIVDEAACSAGGNIKYNADYTKQWSECTVCGGKVNETNHNHSGGEWQKADGKHWKVCTACSQKYSESVHHSTEMDKNETSHWGVCDSCGESVAVTNHTSDGILHTDATNPSKHYNLCAGCGYVMNVTDHSYDTDWSNDGSKHYHACACGARKDEAVCTPGAELKFNADFTKQWKECTECGGKVGETDHNHSGGNWQVDADDHWKVCDVCSQKHNQARHFYGAMTKGEGDDAGYDIVNCSCGHKVKIKTFYSEEEFGELAYIKNGESGVTLKLPVQFEYLTVKGIYGESNTSLVSGNVESGAKVITLSAPDNYFGAKYGTQHVTVDASSAYGDHEIQIPLVVVTRYIESFADILALRDASNVVTGYYALNGDIDAAGANTDGSESVWSGGFGGTLDGRGYSIKNVKATQYGIFRRVSGATIKNISFTNVTLEGAPLLGRVVANTVFVYNVNVEITSLTKADEFGVLFSFRTQYGQNPCEFKNITVNAPGIVIPSVLGGIKPGCVIEGFTVNATAVEKIGHLLDGDNVGEDITTLEGLTLNTAIKVTDLAAAENGSATLDLVNELFTEGASVKVTLNDVTKTLTAANGKLTITLADFSITEMGQYSAVVITGGKEYAFTEIWNVTKVIRTFADLSDLNNTKNSRNTGYYILGGDIHGEWGTIQGGSTIAWNQNSGFGGTFDGRGYTIDRFSVSGYGIFGGIGKGTIKNVNFDMVTLNEGAPLLARTMYNSTVENVTVKLNDFKSTSGECGILVSRQTGTNSVLKDITVDANGKDIYNVLGRIDTSTVIVSNYVINNAGTVTLYGTSDTDGTTAITKPDGLTINSVPTT